MAAISHPLGLASFAVARQRTGKRGPAALGRTEGFIAAHTLLASVYRRLGAFNSAPDPSVAERLVAADVLVPLEALATIAAPVLMISGEHDLIWPSVALQALVARFGNARQSVLPGTGHSPYFEQPEAFNQLIAQLFGTGR